MSIIDYLELAGILLILVGLYFQWKKNGRERESFQHIGEYALPVVGPFPTFFKP